MSSHANAPPPPELIAALGAIVGPAQVLTDEARLEPYVTEWRGVERGYCSAVVRPGSTAEVSRVLALCHETRTPVVPQGGNTGMVAGGVPRGGIVLATERLSAIRALDRDNATMTLEAGCPLAVAQAQSQAHDLTFPLTLASEGSCFIGGNLATNAGGNNTVRFGNTRENVLGLEVVLADGRIWDGLRGLRKNNTGYDLKHLFIGAEGTLGVITAATFRLIPAPADTQTALVACPDAAAVVRLFRQIQRALDGQLRAYEMMPDAAVALAEHHMPRVRLPFDERAPLYVLMEFTQPSGLPCLREGLENCLEAAMEAGLVSDAVLAEGGSHAEGLWRIRESIPEAQSRAGAVIKHDVSVPITAIPEFLDRGQRCLLECVPEGTVVAFGHVGDGNIHFNLVQPAGMERLAFLEQAPTVNRAMHELTVSLGGSFSAEHGIGLVKTAEMARYRGGPELEMMQAIKASLDPHGIMNPGKVLPAPE